MSKQRNYIDRSVTILFALALATTWLAGCGLGESWETYTKENSKLQSNDILDVEVDGENKKWVLTKKVTEEMGVRSTRKVEEYILFGYNDNNWEDYGKSEKVKSAIEDFDSGPHYLLDASSKEGLWMCGSTGLLRIEEGKVHTFEDLDIPRNDESYEGVVESNGVVWAYDYPYLIKYDGNEWTEYKLKHKWEEKSGDIIMGAGNNGGLLIYAGEGSFLKNNIKNIKKGGIIYRYDGESMNKIVRTNEEVTSLHVDSENGIWVTTEEESRRVRKELTLKKYNPDKKGSSWTKYYTHRGISEVTTESPTVAWANVTYAQMGDSRYRVARIGPSSKTVYADDSSPLPSDAKDIEVAPDGSIWFATRKGLAQLSYWW